MDLFAVNGKKDTNGHGLARTNGDNNRVMRFYRT